MVCAQVQEQFGATGGALRHYGPSGPGGFLRWPTGILPATQSVNHHHLANPQLSIHWLRSALPRVRTLFYGRGSNQPGVCMETCRPPSKQLPLPKTKPILSLKSTHSSGSVRGFVRCCGVDQLIMTNLLVLLLSTAQTGRYA